jgi:glyoxylase-like metal-dependent hydrolase (beta-lactamase superfamily II)
MFWKSLAGRGSSFIPLLLIAGGVSGSAQTIQGKAHPGNNSGESKLRAELVKTGLFLISGGGSNSLLRLSANGLILVDGKLPGNYDGILALANKISFSEQPIRIVINTNHYEDRAGNNAKFIEAGAQILAQENVRRNLSTYKPAGAGIASPTKTYDHDFSVHLGGIEVQLMHFGSARTNGDTVVYFPNLKVVAVGDLFTPDTPNPDFSAGGSMVGWGPVLAEILKLDFDVVVPSAGPMVARTDLERFKGKIDTLVSRAAELAKNGVPKGRLMAQLNTDDLGWRLNLTGDRLDRFYNELSGTK